MFTKLSFEVARLIHLHQEATPDWKTNHVFRGQASGYLECSVYYNELVSLKWLEA